MVKKADKLKKYFIVRLLLVMIFIILSEGLINLFIADGVFPVLKELYGVDVVAGHLSGLESVSILLQLLLYIIGSGIFYLLSIALPAPFVVFLQRVLQAIEIPRFIEGPEKVNGLLAVIVIFSLVLYITPYAIGIILYSLMIVKRMEEIREYDRRQRESYIQRRNLLLSDIAHDLKTPITTISGYAQALNEGIIQSPEKQKAYLQTIYTKSMQMNRLITVLFDYVKLDSEGFQLKKEEVELAEFLREISAEMYTDLESAGMELVVDIPQKKCYAMLDKSQFSRAIINLLSNAIKHNPKGTTVHIALSERGNELAVGKVWMIQIQDDGTEIEKSLIEHLFEPFVMGDASRNSRAGSGLGLSITAKIVDMHGGRIWLEQPIKTEGTPYHKGFCIELPQLNEEEEDDYEYGSM